MELFTFKNFKGSRFKVYYSVIINMSIGQHLTRLQFPDCDIFALSAVKNGELTRFPKIERNVG